MINRQSRTFFLLAVCWCALHGPASAAEVEFRPFTYFLSDDPAILGIGGIDPTTAASLPTLYQPTALLDQKRQISYLYSYENDYRPSEGDWAGTRIFSIKSEMTAIVPFEAPVVRKAAIAVNTKDFRFDAAAPSNDGQDNDLHARQDLEAGAVAFSASPYPFLRAGVGREAYRSNAYTFHEVALIPMAGVSFQYRSYRRTMTLESTLSSDLDTAELNLAPFDTQIRAVSVNVAVPETFVMRLESENFHPRNGTFDLRVFLGRSFDAGLHATRIGSEFLDDLAVNGAPGGHISGAFVYEHQDLEVAYHTPATRCIAGMRMSELSVDGAGKADGSSILSFWENLLAGDRYFNYDFAGETKQYYLGIENRTTGRLKLRGGLQYIVVDMDGYFDHWTPFPFINIGKLDEQYTPLEYTKMVLGALTLGFSYRFSDLELTYGVGQLIPIRTVERPGEESIGNVQPDGGGGGDGGGRYDLGKIWEKIKENPGGNVQSVKLTWYF
jgi:hypothetical protein